MDQDWVWNEKFISGKDDLRNSYSCVWSEVTVGHSACRLCSKRDEFGGYIETIWIDDLMKHADCPLHRQRAQALIKERDALLVRIDGTAKLVPSAFSGSPPWFESVPFQYVVNIRRDDGARQELLKQATRLIQEYKRKEPFVLLELALWKAACLLHRPTDADHWFMRDVTSFLAWSKDGWKVNKGSTRSQLLIDTVMRNVKPFLEN